MILLYFMGKEDLEIRNSEIESNPINVSESMTGTEDKIDETETGETENMISF